ncbi:MAG: glycosyltransferase, partial [Solirubrobacterales bacterium]
MRILIFHGYLLRGTGSNVYNAELARALAAAGHEVHLLCQERDARELDFVDAVGDWKTGELKVEGLDRDRPAGQGSCTVYLPPIADLLPVYVADRYDGFTAKPFPELSEEELEFYLRRNVMAVREVCERAKPDCALANHMVMGPFVLARALSEDVPYAVKIHGSAMEYTVRPNPRFLPYAEEGVSRAATVLVGSRHIAERTWDTLRVKGMSERIFLGPPGVDVERFKPRPQTEAIDGLAELADEVYALPRNGYGPAAAGATDGLYDRVRTAARTEGTTSYEEIAELIGDMHLGYENAGIDPQAPDTLLRLAGDADAPLVLYVGKLIVSKGVDLLLAAWPLVRQKHPDARLAITGFGAYREGLELLLSALSDGDLTSAKWIAAGGRAFEGGPAD